MPQELIHQPETRPTNKARDLQDAIIGARKNGLSDPLEIAENILDWFNDSSRTTQIAVLQYAVARLWATTEPKIGIAPIGANARRTGRPTDRHALPEAKIAKIKAKVVADLDRAWLDLVTPMTGAQVRAAKLLPDEMAAAVGDTQRVGDVFTVDQLRQISAPS